MPYQREENFCADLLEMNDLLTRRNEEHPFLFSNENVKIDKVKDICFIHCMAVYIQSN